MKKAFFLLFIITGFLSCSTPEATKFEHKLIPLPQSVDLTETKSNITKIVLPTSVATGFSGLAAYISETDYMSTVSIGNESNVTLNQDGSLAPEEYKIAIEKSNVSVDFSSPQGLQYAVVTLAQLIRDHQSLPIGHIEDNPRFVYRGMHLDVARHFFGVADVKKYIDYLAAYKFNTFHWHLTEDQGWRIEIKKYPRLTEIGGFRDSTIIGHNNAPGSKWDGKRYGGFYTQEQIKEVVQYAANRNITVIPEIELPGHSTAALTAYPELGCGPGPYNVITRWGVFEDIFCPKEETFAFLEDVFDEVLELFPSKLIHIGGDEAPKKAWEESSFVQNLMKEKGLKDEHEMQSYFIQRIEKYLNSKGRNIIGWDEILEGGLAPNAAVMSWRGEEGGIEAARQKHNVVMTPTTYVYLDYYQADKEGEPLAIGGKLTVEDVYNWEPFPSELEEEFHQYIIGGQANLWTEYIKTMDYLEYMVLARMTAVSEVVWSQPELKNYENYTHRLKNHVDYWKSKGVNFADHAVRGL